MTIRLEPPQSGYEDKGGMVGNQIFTLLGVALGAGTSFLVSSLNERMRYRRELRIRWDTHKFEAYGEYLMAVVGMARIAGQIVGLRGLDDAAAKIADERQALSALDEAEGRRTTAYERVYLLGEQHCVEAANQLNRSIWKMEWIARKAPGNGDATPEKWQDCLDDYRRALNSFHQQARNGLQVSGGSLTERVIAKPIER
ncbi:hypothetical protein OUY22_00110 [Nonomuraea sp. MCN248]|uniref:SLATT domain-containing protein n=1 Tax=Nonomuraea corallina TaxID=2989783 RepID=A0ABT4S455_9ACTN|nr:hypothetical protein [Nonomuraea corallina]MDA0631805.1 hypothetical protein [Nonomuraea corallina]